MKVIYEDNHIIVVRKEAGIPSQADKTEDEDMLTIIKAYLKEKYQKPGNVYLGLVHRLDRPVGGVMVFAKTSKAASRLSEQVRNKTFKKSYIAIVNGKMEKDEDTLVDYLWKDEKNNTSYVVKETKKNAKRAELDYRVLKYDKEKNISIIEIDLHTGRHHQIRVQLSSRGHSIVGDSKYHGKNIDKGLCLWSYKLTIEHPITKEKITFSDVPDMKGNWKELSGVDLK